VVIVMNSRQRQGAERGITESGHGRHSSSLRPLALPICRPRRISLQTLITIGRQHLRYRNDAGTVDP
jgi:hypothetical protein